MPYNDGPGWDLIYRQDVYSQGRAAFEINKALRGSRALYDFDRSCGSGYFRVDENGGRFGAGLDAGERPGKIQCQKTAIE